MLQSGESQTPLLVVSVVHSDDVVHSPVQVADKLELCQLAHHPWQAS